MAKVMMQLDDVLLALKGKVEPATGSETVKIPAVVTGSGRAKNVRFDVSETGREELRKLVAAAEGKCADIDAKVERDKQAAWKPVVDLLAKIDKEAEKATQKFAPKKPARPSGENVVAGDVAPQAHGEGPGEGGSEGGEGHGDNGGYENNGYA